MKQKILTLQTLYREGQIRLKDSGIEEYQLDAWYLLEYVTGISKASYYGDPNRELSAAQAEEYRKCIEKRSESIWHFRKWSGFRVICSRRLKKNMT